MKVIKWILAVFFSILFTTPYIIMFGFFSVLDGMVEFFDLDKE